MFGYVLIFLCDQLNFELYTMFYQKPVEIFEIKGNWAKKILGAQGITLCDCTCGCASSHSCLHLKIVFTSDLLTFCR